MAIQRHDLSDQNLTLTIIMILPSFSLKVACSIMHGQPYPIWLDQAFPEFCLKKRPQWLSLGPDTRQGAYAVGSVNALIDIVNVVIAKDWLV